MSGTTPVAGIPFATLGDSPNANTLSQNTAVGLDHLVIAKYASTTARDAANTSPVEGDYCYITGRGFQYRSPTSGWQDFEDPIKAFRTSTLSIGTTKTVYASTSNIGVGTWHITGLIGIAQTVSALTTATLDFTGTATSVAMVQGFYHSDGTAAYAAQTAFSVANGGTTALHTWFTFDCVAVVSVAGSLSIAGQCATTARTADAGGYVQAELWG